MCRRCSRANGACCRIHFSKFVQGPAIFFSRRAVAPFDSGNLARGADRIQFLGRNNTGMTTTANASGSILVVDDQPANLRVVSALLSRSEEHTSELQSLMRISYAVFCLKKKKTKPIQ